VYVHLVASTVAGWPAVPDGLACRQALNAAVFEHPTPQLSDLGYTGYLPNADRLLAAAQSAELDALRAAHVGKLPDAFGVTRRYLWESRLARQLSDERDAIATFGEIMLAVGRPGGRRHRMGDGRRPQHGSATC
jgi:hypothetical protein